MDSVGLQVSSSQRNDSLSVSDSVLSSGNSDDSSGSSESQSIVSGDDSSGSSEGSDSSSEESSSSVSSDPLSVDGSGFPDDLSNSVFSNLVNPFGASGSSIDSSPVRTSLLSGPFNSGSNPPSAVLLVRSDGIGGTVLSNQLVDDLSVTSVLNKNSSTGNMVSSDDLTSCSLGGVSNNLGSSVNNNDDLV